MARQSTIEGTQQKQIAEVNAAGELYYKVMRARVRATKKEVDAKAALIAVLREHKLLSYNDENHVPPLTFTLKPGKDGVKVDLSDGGPDPDDDGKDKDEGK